MLWELFVALLIPKHTTYTYLPTHPAVNVYVWSAPKRRKNVRNGGAVITILDNYYIVVMLL